MLYTSFGNTGLEVSRLGFGGMRFERPQDTESMAEVVLHAFRRGVNYFDTAPEYCDDQSEAIVGMAVKEMKKSGRPFYISTKTMVSTPDAIRRQCESSLRRLNVDSIDFYHVWCLVKPEDLLKRKRAGALGAFRKLKEEGLIRHISVSTHLEHQHIAAMLEEGGGLFESMLIGINVQNYHLRYAGVRAAAERGMAVVTMNTPGRGILADHQSGFVPPCAIPTPPWWRRRCDSTFPARRNHGTGRMPEHGSVDAGRCRGGLDPLDERAIEALSDAMRSSTGTSAPNVVIAVIARKAYPLCD